MKIVTLSSVALLAAFGIASGAQAQTAAAKKLFFEGDIVRHALPGEQVMARVTAETTSYLRADAVEILTRSPDRVLLFVELLALTARR